MNMFFNDDLLQSCIMNMTIRLFGNEAKVAGQRELTFEVDEHSLTASQLLRRVAEECPALENHLEGCRVAVDHDFVEAEYKIEAGSEVALIGAVSGG